MPENRRTAIIAAPPVLAAKIANMLQYGRYEVIGHSFSGNEVKRKAREALPELVVSAYRLNDMMGEKLAAELGELCSVILLVGQSEKHYLGALHENTWCLFSPIHGQKLIDTADMLTARSKCGQRQGTQRSASEKALIERAKQHIGLVYQIEEPEAHRRLQQWSMDSGKTLVEIARIVLEGI